MQFSWQRVVVLAVVVGGAVGAYALGSVELAMLLGGLAGGILVPTNVRAMAKIPPDSGSALIFLCFVLGSQSACGASAYQTHYHTAATSRDAIQEAGEALERVCTIETLEQEGVEFGRGCISAREAQHAAVEAWRTYVTAAAAQGIDVPTVLQLGAQVVALYRETQQFLATRDVELPALEIGD